MKHIKLLSSWFILLSCANTNSKNNDINTVCNALNFLKSKEYKISVHKRAIPSEVIDSLSRINKEEFKIGDITDTININLTDVFAEGGFEYNRKLNFTLVSDSFCLIAYRQGGRGVHDVVEFIKYKGNFYHENYKTTYNLNDTASLRNYFISLGIDTCQ
jgi:hypothetical protein